MSEIILKNAVKQYGVMAVFGRPVLSAGDIRRMAVAENIVNWYHERAKAANWVVWAKEHPEKAALLDQAAKLTL